MLRGMKRTRQPFTARLNRPLFEKPRVSKQALLTPAEIENELQGYLPVESWDQIPVYSKIRYFKEDPEGLAFRYGGRLVEKSNPESILLTSGKNKWTAKKQGNIFFYQLDPADHVEFIRYQERMENGTESLMAENRRLQQELDQYRSNR